MIFESTRQSFDQKNHLCMQVKPTYEDINTYRAAQTKRNEFLADKENYRNQVEYLSEHIQAAQMKQPFILNPQQTYRDKDDFIEAETEMVE